MSNHNGYRQDFKNLTGGRKGIGIPKTSLCCSSCVHMLPRLPSEVGTPM